MCASSYTPKNDPLNHPLEGPKSHEIGLNRVSRVPERMVHCPTDMVQIHPKMTPFRIQKFPIISPKMHFLDYFCTKLTHYWMGPK